MVRKRKGSCIGCENNCCKFCNHLINEKCEYYNEPINCPHGYLALFLYPFDEKDMNPSVREACRKQWKW